MKESKPRILIVEDHIEAQQLIQTVFELDNRFRVEFASQPLLALSLTFNTNHYYSAFLFDLRNQFRPDNNNSFQALLHIAKKIRKKYPYVAMAFFCLDNCKVAEEFAGKIRAELWRSTEVNESGLPAKVAELLEKNRLLI